MTASLAAKRRPPRATTQWWVLTTRAIAPALRNGEVFLSVIAPIFFTLTIYLPLSGVMKDAVPAGSSYAQFALPLIVLQGASVSAITAAYRSATDQTEGINRRFAVMPIAGWTPVAARTTANMFRAAITTVAALICGYVVGFRFFLGPLHTLAFCLVALLLALLLALLGDIVGSINKDPETVSKALFIPQMFFGLLSSGIAPTDQFPGWLGPFVRNQPVSQFINLLRALAGDTADSASPTLGQVVPGLAWLGIGIGICVPLAIRMNSRKKS